MSNINYPSWKSGIPQLMPNYNIFNNNYNWLQSNSNIKDDVYLYDITRELDSNKFKF